MRARPGLRLSPLAASARRARKTVTVLISGIGDRTRSRDLDPELRSRLDDRVFEALGPVLERHGALVERLLDGRVMGLFGVPAAHEDDALRAARAAVELREAGAAGGTVRTGIDTGEVLTGELASREPPATGGAIDGAALLQHATEPGGIVISEATRRLVGDAVVAEPVELPDPDHEARPISAWNLLELIPGAPPFQRRFDTPLVGRELELAQLRQAFERARRERRCQLVTVFGLAGIGKTRLARELARSVEGEATVLTGRCLSYGEGITYWPVREIVGQATVGRGVRELLADSADADVVAERLEAAIGAGTSGAVKEEVFWAVRRLVEALAREIPLLLVFEDVHWGEPTLLDLIEHLADWVREAPVLVVCLARPELLDDRPGWAGGKLNATSILLEPLSKGESTELIGVLPAGAELPPEARLRIAETAEGNPLFLEQVVAMVAQGEDGIGEIVVPPAIQALLAARLDRLEPDERQVLECASVEGETFHIGGIVELSRPDARDAVALRLMSLVRKELIREAGTTLPGEDAFRFRHALIRDAAYEGLSKEARSELHERYAAWLQRATADRAEEAEEFVGYHLEQAYRYRAELAPADDRCRDLAEQAGQTLGSAGRRAFLRGDTPAAVNLLERARSLLAAHGDRWLEIMPELGYALFLWGQLERADAALSEAVQVARAAGNTPIERHASLLRSFCRLFSDPETVDLDGLSQEAEEALELYESVGDDLALARIWTVMFLVYQFSGRSGRLLELAAERAIEHSRRAGSRLDEAWSLLPFGYALVDGPAAVGDAVASCRRRLRDVEGDPLREALLTASLAPLIAMEDRLDDARDLVGRARAVVGELGFFHLQGVLELMSGRVEALAGNLAAAEECNSVAMRIYQQIEDHYLSALACINLARTVVDAERPKEALEVLGELERLHPPPDYEIVIFKPAVRGVALAALGRLAEAEDSVREAKRIAEPTEFLNHRGDVLLDLANVLRLAGKHTEATMAVDDALALYQRKGNVVSARKARALLEELAA